MTVRTQASPILFFLVSAALILLTSTWIVSWSGFDSSPSLLSWAVSLDLMVIIPVLYLLLVGNRTLPLWAIVPIVLACYGLTVLILPAGQRGLAAFFEWVLFPAEIAIVILILVKTIQVGRRLGHGELRSYPFPDRIRSVLVDVRIPAVIIEILVTEISLFYFGLSFWRNEHHASSAEFTIHKETGYAMLVAVFSFLIALETVVLHVLLMQWNITVAWILTGLSLYGMFFLWADFQAIRKLPVQVGQDRLYLRAGLRWSARISYHEIEAIHSEGVRTLVQKSESLRMGLLKNENIVIVLRKPVKIRGLYGISRNRRHIAFEIDNLTNFLDALASKIGEDMIDRKL